MLIANPIYDVVFKYMMEDSKVAKLLISSIIKQDIEVLEFSPKEFTANVDKDQTGENKDKWSPSFIVYRLDFTARIKTDDGEKVVVIEIQKAKFATDILRFRSYLGEQYGNKKNVYLVEKDGRVEKRACEIISIYFLGHKLDNISGIPVIKSEKKYIDVSNGQEINQKEYFIDSLNHESYTILIPELKEKRRNELEKLLSVFDQSNREQNDHILNVNEQNFPEKYQDMIRRLQKAAAVPEIRKNMDVEDEIIESFADLEREIVALKVANQKALDEKQVEIDEKDKIIQELMKKLGEKRS